MLTGKLHNTNYIYYIKKTKGMYVSVTKLVDGMRLFDLIVDHLLTCRNMLGRKKNIIAEHFC